MSHRVVQDSAKKNILHWRKTVLSLDRTQGAELEKGGGSRWTDAGRLKR